MSDTKEPIDLKEMCCFEPNAHSVNFIRDSGADEVLFLTKDVTDTVIKVNRNKLIEAISLYSSSFTAIPMDGIGEMRAHAKSKVEGYTGFLAEKFAQYKERIKIDERETEKHLISRKDFRITIGSAILVACIPNLISYCTNQNDNKILEKRLTELENRPVQQVIVQPEASKAIPKPKPKPKEQ